MLENKREKLSEQLDEAKRLKESLDRRSDAVSTFLQGYLVSSDSKYGGRGYLEIETWTEHTASLCK